MKRKTNVVLAWAVILVLSILPGFSFAQDQVPPGISKQEEMPGKGLRKGWQEGKHKGWDKEKLLKLKTEDPEKFQEVVKEKREHLKERLKYLKENNPQKHQEIMQKIRRHHMARMQNLRSENPEKFKEVIQRRKTAFQERLQKLKTENPERYAQIMQHRQHLQELKRLRKEDPEKFHEYLKNHPRLREHFKNIHDRRKDSGDQGLHKGYEQGVRDKGKAIGQGKGHGGVHRPARKQR